MPKIVKEKFPMPKQEPEKRRGNFNEVALGYTIEQAIEEANRCLQCKKPFCISGCPVEIDIPGFIAKIVEGDFAGSIRLLKVENNLPAMCGRVCPQETQCEQVCVLAKKYQPVAIGRLERFAADWEINHGVKPPKRTRSNGKKVAVIGSGPGGLTAAGDLARMGYKVTIFEALHKTGGVLRYGIPEFRLPKGIVDIEVEYIKKLGVKIETNMVIGRIYTLEDLFKKGFLAIFIGIGAGAPVFMNIPGEELNGVYSANEFLTRSNLMSAYRFPEYDTPVTVGRRVAVIGGGNVAMDAARTSVRLGAESVQVLYRRSEVEMPARIEEIDNAKEEGIIFNFLVLPTRIIGDEKSWVKGIECLRMELGEPDSSGRRRPIPIEGSEFIIDLDTVIVAIGNAANKLLPGSTPGLQTNKWGNIIVDPATGQTSIPGVYAGGDIVTGSATVIEAMGAGKRAARAIHEYIQSLN